MNVKLKFLFILALIIFFVCARVRADVVINEVMFDPEGSDGSTEWVELYNSEDDSQKLDGWDLDPDTGSYKNLDDKIIKGKSFLVIDGISGMRNDRGQVSLYKYLDKPHVHTKDTIVDYLQYGSFDLGTTENIPRQRALDAKIWSGNEYIKIFSEGYTLARKEDGKDTNSPYDWQKSLFPGGTKGETNLKQPEKVVEVPRVYSNKILINEILPHPDSGEKEYIELYNAGEKEDLVGWKVHDASNTGEYEFKNSKILDSKNYLVLYRDIDFNFALNDSGSENLTLFDGNGSIVSNVSYSGSKQGASYNFDGKDWHWSKFLTPNEDNKFEDVPTGDLQIDEDVYVNVYADFLVAGLGKDAKVTWDFGDDHKSYLAETRHKYTKEGKYTGNVTFSEGSEDVAKEFTVDVQEIAHPKIKIVAISANPKGADGGLEFLTIQNKEKKKSHKKINLKGWSIATCWKKCINHPIREDFKLKGKMPKDITNEFSSFTLNNTKAKIELRYPDGKVAQRIKYKKQKGTIAEDEKYVKVKGGWEWVQDVARISDNAASVNAKNSNAEQKASQNINIAIGNNERAEQQNLPENIQEQVITEENNPTKKVENKILQSNFSKIELLGNVTPVEILREENSKYFFTQIGKSEKHYAIIFFENFYTEFNVLMNSLLNKIF